MTAWEAGAVLGNANALESPALDVWDVLLVVCHCGEWRLSGLSLLTRNLCSFWSCFYGFSYCFLDKE